MRCSPIKPLISTRSFSNNNHRPLVAQAVSKSYSFVQQREHVRPYFTSTPRYLTGQEPPSAQAYISSGVLAGQKNLVDVKKVLVIGSGGLSIGQAGEFDYSGMDTNQMQSLSRQNHI